MMEAHLSTVRDNNKPARELMSLSAADLAGHEFAPPVEWGAMGEPGHFVQFYESDAFLLDSLRDFVRAGLRAGDACIVVTKQAYRAELEERLRAEGLDVMAASACGQYITL